MKRLLTITTLSLALSLPAVAGAAPNDLTRALRGDYAFSGDGSCLQSANGFANFRANPAPGAPGLIRSFSVHGVRTFNGDGTGTVKGRTVEIGHQPNPANAVNPNSTNTGFVVPTNFGPFFTNDFSAKFTYTVAPDHSLHIVNGPLTHTQIQGPNIGQTGAWTGINIDGHVSQDFKTIVVATPGSVLETEYASEAAALNGGTPTNFRYCHRSRTLIRISDGDHEDRGRGQTRFPF